MNDYREIRASLESLRRELIKYVSSNDEFQDLSESFLKIKQHDPATYELLLLIYNEFKTQHKMNKKQLVALLDNAIEVKYKTVNKMIQEKEKGSSFFGMNINLSKLINRALLTWMGVTVFLLLLYTINPEGYKAIIQDSITVVRDLVIGSN
jgi:hypothetical protein